MKITDLSIQSKDIQIETLSNREAAKVTGGMGKPGEGGILVPPCNGGWPWWPVPAPSGGNSY